MCERPDCVRTTLRYDCRCIRLYGLSPGGHERTRPLSRVSGVGGTASDRLACQPSNPALKSCPQILTEVRDVLSRQKIQVRFPHQTSSLVDLILQKIDNLSVSTDCVPDAGFGLRDPNDLPSLNLAVANRAEFLVSWDDNLRELMQDPTFVARFPFANRQSRHISAKRSCHGKGASAPE